MTATRDRAAADEATLVALAKIGDRPAFDELVKRRQSWLRNLLRRLCGDAALADDLAQQAYLLAWRGIGGLKANGAFGGWLRRLGVNAFMDHVRRRDPLNAVDANSEATLEMLAETPVPLAENIDLDRALQLLSPPVRLCIVLSYKEGMSHSGIVEATGLPLGTVKSHINRGLQQLRKLLGTNAGE
jgi:RNA polymerase sigma factor (sigma-70 family)